MSMPFTTLGTATLSDALDRLGIAGQASGIRSIIPDRKVSGRAFTVRFVPTTGRGGTVGDFIDSVAPGSVLVLDNGGRRDVTVWGDLLTTTAALREISGTIIHGVCRDTERIRDTGYPVFSRGVHMRTGKDRVRAESIQEIVSIGEASVAPGDLVVGDADGVVVIPKAEEEAVLELARQVDDAERRIRLAVEAGTPLRDAREAVGYHHLQRRTNA
jgi:4-hydroxy-4-methyl-2-oxoglutarate aldolase